MNKYTISIEITTDEDTAHDMCSEILMLLEKRLDDPNLTMVDKDGDRVYTTLTQEETNELILANWRSSS